MPFDPDEYAKFVKAQPQQPSGFDPNEYAAFVKAQEQTPINRSDSAQRGVTEQPSVGMDVARSIAGKVPETLGGIVTGPLNLLTKGVGAAANYLAPGSSFSQSMQEGLQQAEANRQAIARLRQPDVLDYTPQTSAGQTAAQLTPYAAGMAAGPRNLLTRAVTSVALPAAGGEAAGALARDTPYEPYARAGGALLGGAAAPIAFGAGSRLITPFAATPERQAAMQTLRNEGITSLPAGMATGSKALSAAESELARSKYAGAVDRSYDQFTQAALKRGGLTGERATPETLNKNRSDIGAQFDAVAARNPSIPVAGVHPTLDAIRQDFINLTGNSNPYLDSLPARIGTDISGRDYQTISSEIGRMQRASSNPELKLALGDTKNALDAAIENGLTDKNDIMQWQNARRRYANLMTIEKAVNTTTEAAAQGLVTPPNLTNAIKSQSPKSYVRGQGDFSDLARAGNLVMKPFQDSGTALRGFTRAIPGLILGTVGGAVHPAGLAIGAAPWLAGKALMSPPAQAYLRNQLLTGTRMPTAAGGLLPAVLASQRQVQTPYGAQ
jgi:hypothetical protein